MVGLLIKKEFKNLFRTYFVNQKSGKGYSKAKTFGFICLFVFLILITVSSGITFHNSTLKVVIN